jgi:hypothetical protein
VCRVSSCRVSCVSSCERGRASRVHEIEFPIEVGVVDVGRAINEPYQEELKTCEG